MAKARSLNDIIEKIGTTAEQRAKYCTDRGRDNTEPYCLSTSCTSCKGCKFFHTNMVGQGKIILEQYEKMEQENKEINEAFNEWKRAMWTVATALQALNIFTPVQQPEEHDKIITATTRRLVEDVIAEARKIVNAGGNAAFVCEDGRHE